MAIEVQAFARQRSSEADVPLRRAKHRRCEFGEIKCCSGSAGQAVVCVRRHSAGALSCSCQRGIGVALTVDTEVEGIGYMQMDQGMAGRQISRDIECYPSLTAAN